MTVERTLDTACTWLGCVTDRLGALCGVWMELHRSPSSDRMWGCAASLVMVRWWKLDAHRASHSSVTDMQAWVKVLENDLNNCWKKYVQYLWQRGFGGITTQHCHDMTLYFQCKDSANAINTRDAFRIEMEQQDYTDMAQSPAVAACSGLAHVTSVVLADCPSKTEDGEAIATSPRSQHAAPSAAH